MTISISKIPPCIPIFGDKKYRNKKCPKETPEQVTFVNWVRSSYPSDYGKLLVHPRNEGLKSEGQFSSIARDKAMGHLTKGAADIIIPAKIPFVCEIKRADMTLSKIDQDQIYYLLIAQRLGAFSCIALGHVGAIEGFNEWLKLNNA